MYIRLHIYVCIVSVCIQYMYVQVVYILSTPDCFHFKSLQYWWLCVHVSLYGLPPLNTHTRHALLYNTFQHSMLSYARLYLILVYIYIYIRMCCWCRLVACGLAANCQTLIHTHTFPRAHPHILIFTHIRSYWGYAVCSAVCSAFICIFIISCCRHSRYSTCNRIRLEICNLSLGFVAFAISIYYRLTRLCGVQA